MAGLAVPIIIHLWNQRPGKTLRVGSVALVTENKVSRQRNIQLTELLLLLLRCLLIAAIVLALAGLQWRSSAKNTTKGWVLLPKAKLQTNYQHFKPAIDSLLKLGMEFHYFKEGFEKENFEKAITIVDTSKEEVNNYRSIVSSLNEVADANQPIYIFTDNYLRNFKGARDAVSLNLHWFGFTPDSNVLQPKIDTSVISVSIYQHGYANDAHYVKAAVEAIQEYSKKNIRIANVSSLQALPANEDWLFWFSDEPLPKDKHAENIFQYATGKANSCNSYIQPIQAPYFDPVKLYKFITAPDSTAINTTIKWSDGFGHAILSKQSANDIAYYKLFTHFDPAWNELPWNEAFPQILYQLMNEQKAAKSIDNTIIDSSQMLPIMVPAKSTSKQKLFDTTSLSYWCWLLAFLFFLAERMLSFYKNKTSANE